MLGGADSKKLLKMENLAQRRTDQAVVRVGRHQVTHVLPPLLTDLRRGDGRPPFLAFDFGRAEELRFEVQEDRIVRDTVIFEHLLQFRPNRIVALLLFLFGAGVDRPDEGFADFHDLLV